MQQTLTSWEKETILRFSEATEDHITLETFNKKHALRLIRDGAEVKATRVHGGATYWTLWLPKPWFRWPRKPSEARKAASKARYDAGLAAIARD